MILSEKEMATRVHFVKKKPTRLGVVTLGEITRILRTVRGLKGKVFVVGGIVTEGSTLRDIDIVVNNPDDIPTIKKVLGKYAKRAHFMIQKKEPPATEFVKVTGKEPRSADRFRKKQGKKLPKFEYAS